MASLCWNGRITLVLLVLSLTTLLSLPKYPPILLVPDFLETYLSTLFNRGEKTESEYKFLRPKAPHFGRAHGLPKTHKPFLSVPKFRPIIDTTNTPHHDVGKFLSNLLNPLTLNDYTLRDCFESVDAIKAIPEHLFSEGYRYVSFDVESLSTNVPLKKNC